MRATNKIKLSRLDPLNLNKDGQFIDNLLNCIYSYSLISWSKIIALSYRNLYALKIRLKRSKVLTDNRLDLSINKRSRSSTNIYCTSALRIYFVKMRKYYAFTPPWEVVSNGISLEEYKENLWHHKTIRTRGKETFIKLIISEIVVDIIYRFNTLGFL